MRTDPKQPSLFAKITNPTRLKDAAGRLAATLGSLLVGYAVIAALTYAVMRATEGLL